MDSKQTNKNYDILDKILSDSDRAERKGGEWVDLGNGEGAWVTSKGEFEKLAKNVEELEKYLRS